MLKKTILLILIILSFNINIASCEANTPPSLVEPLTSNSKLDVFDENSLEDLLINLDEIDEQEQDSPLSTKIKLLWAYIKIESLQTKESIFKHISQNKIKYISATGATTSLIAILYIIKYLVKKNANKNS